MYLQREYKAAVAVAAIDDDGDRASTMALTECPTPAQQTVDKTLTLRIAPNKTLLLHHAGGRRTAIGMILSSPTTWPISPPSTFPLQVKATPPSSMRLQPLRQGLHAQEMARKEKLHASASYIISAVEATLSKKKRHAKTPSTTPGSKQFLQAKQGEHWKKRSSIDG